MNDSRNYFILNSGEITALVLCTFTISGVYGFICFLSFNFVTIGDWDASILFAAIIGLLFSIPVFIATLLKKTRRPSKIRIILEWLFLLVFVIVALLALGPFSHYFVVFEKRADIQKSLLENVTQAESMFVDYESYSNNRLDNYKALLNSVVHAKLVNPSKYNSFGFVSDIRDEVQIDSKFFALRAQVYPSNYSEMKQVDSTYLANAKTKLTVWSPTGIVEGMTKVPMEIDSWYSKLKGFSTFRGNGEIADDFEYTLSFADVSEQLSVLSRPTIFSILIALLSYSVILLPYFAISRDTKYPGLKVLFRLRDNSDNTTGGTIVFK